MDESRKGVEAAIDGLVERSVERAVFGSRLPSVVGSASLMYL